MFTNQLCSFILTCPSTSSVVTEPNFLASKSSPANWLAKLFDLSFLTRPVVVVCSKILQARPTLKTLFKVVSVSPQLVIPNFLCSPCFLSAQKRLC